MGYNGKYYYLKVKENFFDIKQIVVLEAMPDGYVYLNILLKLLCKADYHSHGEREIGTCTRLMSISKYISVLCKVDETLVLAALKVLQELNIIRIEENLIIIKDPNIDVKRNRSTKIYKEWRKSVFEKDKFTCMNCGEKGGKLNAHHIKEWARYEEDRFDIKNGITLCESCHKFVHRKKVVAK